MFRAITVSLSIFLFGCSSINYDLPSEKIDEKEQQLNKTSLFYYYVNPVRPAQSAAVVEGNFAWKDGCIYLVGKDGVYNTAMFPLYPKGIVKWDEASKTLALDGHVYKMGDFISTNGQYSDYVPKSPIGIEYENQGDKKCLNPTLAQIGTMSIE